MSSRKEKFYRFPRLHFFLNRFSSKTFFPLLFPLFFWWASICSRSYRSIKKIRPSWQSGKILKDVLGTQTSERPTDTYTDRHTDRHTDRQTPIERPSTRARSFAYSCCTRKKLACIFVHDCNVRTYTWVPYIELFESYVRMYIRV